MTLDIRILNLGLKSGTYNTAIDSVIQNEVATGKSPATIMFTRWKPTVSVGIAQSSALDVDAHLCEKYGIELVRRKSGGQSVYLDDEYIVYSVIAPRGCFPKDVGHLRKTFCDSVIGSLTAHKVPAVYHDHGNIVIYPNKGSDEIRQIGNSGQMVGANAVVIHGSIRYSRQNLPRMIEVLRINNHSLESYAPQIKQVLASVDEYSQVSKEEILSELANSFASYLKGNLIPGKLTSAEELAMTAPEKYLSEIADQKTFTTKGVCYLDMNGRHLIAELAKLLPNDGTH